MENTNSTVLVRIRFSYDGIGRSNLNFMLLRMQYDDGFVAFLNGVPLASVNAPGTLDRFSSAAVENPDSAAVIFEDFNADAD